MDGCGDGGKIKVSFSSLTEGARGPSSDNVSLVEIGGSCSSIPMWLIVMSAALVTVATVIVIVHMRRRRTTQEAPAVADTQLAIE